jgi:hypothetical protein
MIPYSLSLGESVEAKLYATNVQGDSLESAIGDGALIITIPDPPVSLTEDELQRSATNLAITWDIITTVGIPEQGYSAVVDYRVSIAEQYGEYTVLGTTTDQSFLATDLSSGTFYEFKVEARNMYGYSEYSDMITLLSAYIPEPPINIVTTIEGDQVKVEWELVTSNGSPILAYNVYVQEIGTTTFTLESTDCDGT